MRNNIVNEHGVQVFEGLEGEDPISLQKRYLSDPRVVRDVDLSKWNLYGQDVIYGIKFINCLFSEHFFENRRFLNCEFANVSVAGMFFRSTRFHECMFRNSNLQDTDARYAVFANSNLVSCQLQGMKIRPVSWASFGLPLSLLGVYLTSGEDDTSEHAILLQHGLINYARRMDGFIFMLWNTEKGKIITAGCRFFTVEEAYSHWRDTRGDNTDINRQTWAILNMFREVSMDFPGGWR